MSRSDAYANRLLGMLEIARDERQINDALIQVVTHLIAARKEQMDEFVRFLAYRPRPPIVLVAPKGLG